MCKNESDQKTMSPELVVEIDVYEQISVGTPL